MVLITRTSLIVSVCIFYAIYMLCVQLRVYVSNSSFILHIISRCCGHSGVHNITLCSLMENLWSVTGDEWLSRELTESQDKVPQSIVIVSS